MKTYQTQFTVFRIVIDLIMIGAVFFVSAVLAHGWGSFTFTPNDIYVLVVIGLVWYGSARSQHLYDEFRSRNFSFEFVAILKTLTVHMIGIVFVLFLLQELVLTREFVLIYAGAALLVIGVEKYVLRYLIEKVRIRGKNLRNVVIVGAGYVGRKFRQSIKLNPQFGYSFTGYLDEKPRPNVNGEYLGHIDNLENVLMNNKVDDVIIALPTGSRNSIEQVIRVSENFPVNIRIVPDYIRFLSPKFRLTMFDNFPVISVKSYALEEMHWRFLKRVFDIVFTGALFVLIFWWLFPLIALGIKINSRGPVFFKQERWGKNNERIECYKFRTMYSTSKSIDESGKYKRTEKNDPRITKLGKFLRATNLDEIPQFINVLKGEMSVAGPRPHATPLNLESKDTIQYYMRRHLVKPGITGWAQVNGFRGGSKDPRHMQKRIEYDIWYIENWSLLLDIQIVFLTVINMVKGDPMAY